MVESEAIVQSLLNVTFGAVFLCCAVVIAVTAHRVRWRVTAVLALLAACGLVGLAVAVWRVNAAGEPVGKVAWRSMTVWMLGYVIGAWLVQLGVLTLVGAGVVWGVRAARGSRPGTQAGTQAGEVPVTSGGGGGRAPGRWSCYLCGRWLGLRGLTGRVCRNCRE
jgi:hypothetical protein